MNRRRRAWLSWCPGGAPAGDVLGLLTSAIQALIFATLAAYYIGEAVHQETTRSPRPGLSLWTWQTLSARVRHDRVDLPRCPQRRVSTGSSALSRCATFLARPWIPHFRRPSWLWLAVGPAHRSWHRPGQRFPGRRGRHCRQPEPKARSAAPCRSPWPSWNRSPSTAWWSPWRLLFAIPFSDAGPQVRTDRPLPRSCPPAPLTRLHPRPPRLLDRPMTSWLSFAEAGATEGRPRWSVRPRRHPAADGAAGGDPHLHSQQPLLPPCRQAVEDREGDITTSRTQAEEKLPRRSA